MSREIDALVAKHVMGWQLSPSGKTWRTVDKEGIYPNGWKHRDYVRNFRPSSDPVASKALRVRMCELGWCVKIEVSPAGRVTVHVGRDEVVFTHRGCIEEVTFALAALKALGVEVLDK